MKSNLIIATLFAAAVSSYGQGYFNFDNTVLGPGAASLPTIGANSAPGQGTTGQIIGSGSVPNYDIGYSYAVGTFLTQSAYLAASPTYVSSFSASFFAATGDTADGAGLVGAGNAVVPGNLADGTQITIELLAWYDPTGTTSYTTALANNWNTGFSAPLGIRLASGSDQVVADISGASGFSVSFTPTPEPSTLALAGLGGFGMLMAMRRKKA
jgi:hypothetical protein